MRRRTWHTQDSGIDDRDEPLIRSIIEEHALTSEIKIRRERQPYSERNRTSKPEVKPELRKTAKFFTIVTLPPVKDVVSPSSFFSRSSDPVVPKSEATKKPAHFDRLNTTVSLTLSKNYNIINKKHCKVDLGNEAMEKLEKYSRKLNKFILKHGQRKISKPEKRMKKCLESASKVKRVKSNLVKYVPVNYRELYTSLISKRNQADNPRLMRERLESMIDLRYDFNYENRPYYEARKIMNERLKKAKRPPIKLKLSIVTRDETSDAVDPIEISANLSRNVVISPPVIKESTKMKSTSPDFENALPTKSLKFVFGRIPLKSKTDDPLKKSDQGNVPNDVMTFEPILPNHNSPNLIELAATGKEIDLNSTERENAERIRIKEKEDDRKEKERREAEERIRMEREKEEERIRMKQQEEARKVQERKEFEETQRQKKEALQKKTAEMEESIRMKLEEARKEREKREAEERIRMKKKEEDRKEKEKKEAEEKQRQKEEEDRKEKEKKEAEERQRQKEEEARKEKERKEAEERERQKEEEARKEKERKEAEERERQKEEEARKEKVRKESEERERQKEEEEAKKEKERKKREEAKAQKEKEREEAEERIRMKEKEEAHRKQQEKERQKEEEEAKKEKERKESEEREIHKEEDAQKEKEKEKIAERIRMKKEEERKEAEERQRQEREKERLAAQQMENERQAEEAAEKRRIAREELDKALQLQKEREEELAETSKNCEKSKAADGNQENTLEAFKEQYNANHVATNRVENETAADEDENEREEPPAKKIKIVQPFQRESTPEEDEYLDEDDEPQITIIPFCDNSVFPTFEVASSENFHFDRQKPPKVKRDIVSRAEKEKMYERSYGFKNYNFGTARDDILKKREALSKSKCVLKFDEDGPAKELLLKASYDKFSKNLNSFFGIDEDNDDDLECVDEWSEEDNRPGTSRDSHVEEEWDFTQISLNSLVKKYEWPFQKTKGLFWPITIKPIKSTMNTEEMAKLHIRRLLTDHSSSCVNLAFFVFTARTTKVGDSEPTFSRNYDTSGEDWGGWDEFGRYDVLSSGRFLHRKSFKPISTNQTREDGRKKYYEEEKRYFEEENRYLEARSRTNDWNDARKELMSHYVRASRYDVYSLRERYGIGKRDESKFPRWTKSGYDDLDVAIRDEALGKEVINLTAPYDDHLRTLYGDQFEKWCYCHMLASLYFQFTKNYTQSSLEPRDYAKLKERSTKYNNWFKSGAPRSMAMIKNICKFTDVDKKLWTLQFHQLVSAFKELPSFQKLMDQPEYAKEVNIAYRDVIAKCYR